MQKRVYYIATSFFPLSALAIFILLNLNGCEDKKSQSPFIPTENTTEIFASKNKKTQAKNNKKTKKQKNDIQVVNNISNVSDTYILKEKRFTRKITIHNKAITFHNINTPVVMIQLHKANYSLYKLQKEALRKLEKLHRKKFTMLSIVDNGQDKEMRNLSGALRKTLTIQEDTDAPLTVIYKNGKHYSHFEGSAPVEMISHDILQAIKK